MSNFTYFYFKKLNNLIGHLPKSKILAGASLPDGKFKFYLSGKKQGKIEDRPIKTTI